MAKGKDKAAKALMAHADMKYQAALNWHRQRRPQIAQYAEEQGIGYRKAMLALFDAEQEIAAEART